MTEIKVVIGDPKSKRCYQKAVSGADAEKLFGKRIGDMFHGELVGLLGYELGITGGSDSAGFPMRRDVHKAGRDKPLLSKGVGFSNIKIEKKSKKKVGELKYKYKIKGKRVRKTVRGDTVSADIAQVNVKVIKEGKESIDKLLGIEIAKPEEKGAEGTAEAVNSEVKQEKESSRK